MHTVATFYHLTPLENPATLQKAWKQFLIEHHVTGTILVTPEGVNATIAGPDDGVNATLAMLRQHPSLTQLTAKFSTSTQNPFPRTKVKLKRETIPLGTPVNHELVGTYIPAQQWNALISKPDTITIDTRNDYEVQIGHFSGALNPATRTFKELPAWLESNLPTDKSTPIAMYCTGGIRCEKSTAYLRQQGYENVYHLEGGILKYLEEVPESQSLWQGDCYVFDDRVAVNHQLQPSKNYQICKVCNAPITAGDLKRQHLSATCSHQI